LRVTTCLTSKRLNELKINSWIQKSGENTGKPLPPGLRSQVDVQRYLNGTETKQQITAEGPSAGIGKTHTVTDEAQRTQENLHTLCGFGLQEFNQFLTVNTGEKSACDSGRGTKKGSILKYMRALFFIARPTSGDTI
jgi:hypothetical protein